MSEATLDIAGAAQETRAKSAENGGVRRRLRALVVKETIQIFRDPSSILIAFVLPLILLFLFGYGVSLDVDRVRIGLVVESPSRASENLAGAFKATRYFDVAQANDRRIFEDDVVAGRLRGIVVIPANFEERIAAADPALVQVIADGSEPNTAKFVQNYARGVVQNWRAQNLAENARAAPGVNVQSRFWFNPELASRFFLVPGSIAIVMTLIGTLLTALVVAREWERGTMEAMMATPIGVAELLAGKLAPYLALGLVSMMLCTIVGVALFGVPLRGSIVALLLIAFVFLLPALGQGLVISAATKNQFVASQIALITGFLPAFLLSGFIFEISSMPGWIQTITYVVPARYLIPSLQTVFLAGDVWSLILPNLGAMLLIGTVFFGLSALVTNKRLD